MYVDSIMPTHLFGSARLSLEDGFGSLVVLVSHGTGKRRHALSVSNIQPDFRVGDEQLDDDALLVADGDVDWSTTF